MHLLDRVDRDVAGTRHDDPRAVERAALGLQHRLHEEHGAVAGGLGAHLRSAPGEALAGEDARLVAVRDALVLAEQVADLATSDAGVTGRDVGVLADVPVELRHERLAEAHDLGVGAALRVEVGPALAAADRHAGEGVLEDLLEAEELHDAEVDARVEAQPALVGPQRRVELDPEPAVQLHATGVVGPRDAEDDLALRLAQAADDLGIRVLRVLPDDGRQALQHLAHGLVELLFPGVPVDDLVEDVGQRRVERGHGGDLLTGDAQAW